MTPARGAPSPKTVMGTAKLLGDKAALKALKEGEESGVKQYQAVSQDPDSPDRGANRTEIMSRHQAHVRRLDVLIDAERVTRQWQTRSAFFRQASSGCASRRLRGSGSWTFRIAPGDEACTHVR